MTERELLALMAAALYRDEPQRGMLTQIERAVYDAKYLLEAVDERMKKDAVRAEAHIQAG